MNWSQFFENLFIVIEIVIQLQLLELEIVFVIVIKAKTSIFSNLDHDFCLCHGKSSVCAFLAPPFLVLTL